MSNSKIIRFSAENVKRLNVVEITPDGNVIIGGNNAQGKSSILDAIVMVLGGKNALPEEPLKKGQKKGKVTLDLGDIIATRTFTPSGSTLTLKNKEGATYSSPQSILDGLTAKLTFEPMVFLDLEPKEQAEQVRIIAGLDFSELDAERAKIYENRTTVNRDLAILEAKLKGSTFHDDAPEDKIAVIELTKKLSDITMYNSKTDDIVNRGKQAKAAITLRETEISMVQKTIEEMTSKLKELEEGHAALNSNRETIRQEYEAHVKAKPTDTAEALTEQVNAAGDKNTKFDENRDYKALQVCVEETRSEVATMTAGIEQIDTEKAEKLSAVTLPVEGLSFNDTGVLFNNIPFEQASSAEKTRVAMAIAVANNPTLRIALIRDGSLLDENSMKMLCAEAERMNVQLWIEVVGNREDCSVIIEDGKVKE